MPNSNYNRGRAREYQVMNALRSKGWMCSRSAMSHGPVDVFAAKNGRVILIQVKSGSARINSEELKLLKSFAKAFNADAQVWSFKKRGKVDKTTVSKRNLLKKSSLPVIRPVAEVSKPLEEIKLSAVAQRATNLLS